VVAVNLSAVHFRQGQVEEDVLAALEASGLSPANLELELTESLLLDQPEGVIATLARWKARGLRLSIEDFGTGYSSLAYLKRFKVDKLKIRPLVHRPSPDRCRRLHHRPGDHSDRPQHEPQDHCGRGRARGTGGSTEIHRL
jgi:EAL domain-containing protein (putative c-di-GMP-specific phosphodiesterase class I)